MKILVAEDDPFASQLLQAFLTKHGHECVMTQSGEEALEQFREEPTRVLITDWRMPGMSGPELCRCIREESEGQYTYVIVLTAKALGPEALTAHVDDFITKPFNPIELEFRLQTAERVLLLEDRMKEQLQQVRESQMEAEQAHAQLDSELHAAAELQRAMLPQHMPGGDALQISWAFEPSGHLGGDTFNAFQLADNRYALAVVDVCGHGINPALLAVTLQHILNPNCTHTPLLWADAAADPAHRVVPPTEVLARLNQQFPMELETAQYFTLLYAILETDTGLLRYSTAGHPPPLLIPADQSPVRQLPGTGCPIGLSPDNEFDVIVQALQSGDRLLLFSDGLFETRNTHGEQIGIEGVLSWVEEARSLDADGLVRCLSENVINWAGKERPDDDVSLLLVEYTGRPNSSSTECTRLASATAR